MSLRLHIERVVVHGLPGGAAQGREFADALSAELARLLGPAGAGRAAAPARTAPAAAVSGMTGGAAGLARAVAGSVAATLSREIRR